jgi:hypothetical protein
MITTGSRRIKKRLLACLENGYETTLAEVGQYPARIIINPLLSLFYHHKDEYRWCAISIAGRVVSKLAQENMESARVIMRRLMWNLNDESGGIGWGSPEAMGDIIARNRKVASEYATILASYINPEGNFLEHEVLQRGVLWGIGRAAKSGHQAINAAAPWISPFLSSDDPYHRGLAAWACGRLKARETKPLLAGLIGDDTVIRVFRSEKLENPTVGRLATEALKAL